MDLDQLKRHLAEDERVALACRGEAWELQNEAVYGAASADVIAEVGMHRTNTPPEVGDHIARHDPARALRWVRAAREILVEHQPGEDEDMCVGCGYSSVMEVRHRWPCLTVRSIMSVYGDTDG